MVTSGIALIGWTDYHVWLGSWDASLYLDLFFSQYNRIAAFKLGNYHPLSGML